MTRPLSNLTVADLTAMAERNWSNAAELELIRSELMHRSTAAALKLRETVETWIADCKTNQPAEAKVAAESSISEQVRDWTYEAVAKLRAKLIDLSRKSPLISFKHTSRSASQLRFVDERPDLLFTRLTSGTMGFEPLPGEEQTPPDERTPQFGIAYERARLIDEEFLAATNNLGDNEGDARAWQDAERALRGRVREQLGLPKLNYGKGIDVAAIARAHGFDPSFDLKTSDDDGLAAHHEDDRIRVLLTQKELERRLKSVADRATSHLRETGHHTLHLVFGFVQWHEDDTSDIVSHAPLLLLPVALEKDEKRARKEYRLGLWEGGLEVNVALIEKAREHWGLKLPPLREEESPESYFIRAKAVLDQGRRLTLRNFVTLSVLPPMVLWRDLNPENWPTDAFANHRLLPGMIGATELGGSAQDDMVVDIDDPAHAARVPALITDADASQHRAIMDMAAGQDMAIEGPPGTGKSQTITNMIATALAQGKRVLFVAEKQAALRVVADRLGVAGFGPLLLELHGDKASRASVYEGVRERLEAQYRHDARALEEKRVELRRHRDLLRRYLSLVRTPLGKLAQTAHTLAWREIRLRALFTREQVKALEKRWSLRKPLELDRPTLIENRELLAQFGQALAALDTAQGNGARTRWSSATQLDPFDQSAALDAAAGAGRAGGAVALVAARFAELGIVLPGPAGKIRAADDQLGGLTPFSSTEELVVGAALHNRHAATELIALQCAWLEQRDSLVGVVDHPDTISTETAEALRDAIAIDRCPETADAVAGERAASERLSKELAAVSRDIERIGERLSNGLQSSTQTTVNVALKMAGLGKVSPSAGAMLTMSILDSAVGTVVDGAARDAAALVKDRTQLAGLTQSEVSNVEPAELDALAETLETTGIFGRMLGGQYKAAKRRSARYLIDASDREQSADILRRVGALTRARRAFWEENKARSIFPAMLWDGIDSDFAAMQAAHALATDAASQLTALDEFELLRWWLTADSTDRQRFCATCERLVAALSLADSVGLSDVQLGDLPARCASRADVLRNVEAAIASAGVRSTAELRRADGSIADALLRLNQMKRSFDQVRSSSAFDWVGTVAEPLDLLQTSLTELDQVGRLSGPIDMGALLIKSDAPLALVRSIVDASPQLTDATRAWSDASDGLRDVCGIDTGDLCDGLSWDSTATTLTAMSADGRGAGLAADLLKYRAALTTRGLSGFAEAATAKEIEPQQLDDVYELLSISALLKHYLGTDGAELGRLGSLSLDAARQSFKRLDKELHKLEAAAIVSKRLGDKAPIGIGYGRKSDYSELRLLENEVELTRPRTPLRDVVHRAGAALQALKPVWMMSPTSIAQFIRPGSLTFDLLIVDEASQMRPEFSISCILRAEQFIVVGDANQLPPSDHFQVAGTVDDGDDDGVGVDESTESILDLANQRFRRKPRLKWHYRSQHESLIQFSNREFYDRDLVVFPSPMANDDDLLGVKCFYVPSFYPDTVYESSINQREAEFVIDQAFGLMQTHPERSIGIVAMNSKQTELIQNEFDRLIVEEERVAKYVESFVGTIDEFFIKNLENVQGDERDIILISTVYGPGKDGNVRQNFGLMSREVGWRRLNVLVTRAKMSCRLVTSLRPDDIKVTDNSSRGVTAFKSYLTYAHRGAHYDDASGGETDSDFEIFVADALRGAGYEVVYQVGVENFRIDLGVRHENCPVGFIAGIECDGAPYHSGLSVRDRDHIRQTVLENLGWNIYRVWSTDWFADPARETAKLVAWVDLLRDRIMRELASRLTSEAVATKPRKSSPPVVRVEAPAAEVVSTSAPEADLPTGLSDAPAIQIPREPRGRELRSIGDFNTFEAIRGRLYEIWKSERFVGEVEVIKRATASPRLYGDRAVAAQSEYEGRVEHNGDCFRSFDLYAAMREVASRAPDIA